MTPALPDLDGTAFSRGDDGYEAARSATVWNARTPERYPDVVVQAASEADVVAAVGFAASEGLTVGVRSGGHSWAGSHVRDGGVLLDVSRLRERTIDTEAMTATAQPGSPGNEALADLLAVDRFFPAGHCPGVALGGYLLQGGFGWNGRVHGPACMSVEAIDVVTADGELIRASEEENADLLWAARGSGPGFFGAVTRFHLRTYEAPKVIANAIYTYPLGELDALFSWAGEIGPEVPDHMELMLFIHRDEAGEAEVAVTGPVLAANDAEADAALGLLGSCPSRPRAKLALPRVDVGLADLYAGVHASYPDDHRYCVDNVWTHAPVEDLLPGLHRIAETIPTAPSHMLWMNWGESPERPDMAYSVEDRTYIACYGVWAEEADDDAYAGWATDSMRALEPHSSGIQLADENLINRPARFIAEEKMDRLDELRAKWDPEGRFHPWLGRP